MKWRLLLRNSRNEIYCWYLMYCDYSSQQRDKFVYEKMFFPNLWNSHFPFFWETFEMFIKTHVLLCFYNETRSSHRRCFIKKLFLKISQYSQTHVLESLFNKVGGLQAWLQKRPQHMHFPVNPAKCWRTSLLKNICKRLLPMTRSLLHHK